mgnify:CR=1 FL=1
MLKVSENMNYEPINISDKLDKFNELWTPRVIAEMNDYQFKLAKGLVQVLLVEPKGIVNTGSSGGEMTAENDIWV